MKIPALAEVENVERGGEPVNLEYVPRHVIEINEYSSKATPKDTQAPKTKCPSSHCITCTRNCGVSSVFPPPGANVNATCNFPLARRTRGSRQGGLQESYRPPRMVELKLESLQ